MLALLKSDFSIGRSIIQMGRVSDSVHNSLDQPDNVQDILEDYKWDKLFLVEDELGGFVPGYLTAQKAGAQLIFGWRVSMVDSGEKKEKQPSSKAIIFVKSEEGWKKLVKIATKAQIDYFFEGARMDWKTLQEMWSDELLLAIPHYDGFLHKNLCSKEQSIPDFGSIKPYVFLEDCDLPFDNIIRRKSEEYAAAYGLKTLNVKTCYYKNRADLVYFQARKLMDRKTHGSGGTIDEPNMEFFCSAEFSLESWEEKKDLVTEGELSFVKEFEKPLELFMPGVRLPEFILDEEDRKEYKIKKGASNIEILRVLARHGYKDKLEKGIINKERQKEYGERFEYEIKMLEQTGFDSYILLVWDTTRYAEKNNLAHGFGRGSAAGSLVNYLIGIVGVDPIEHGLYFERFISLSRAKTATIDGVKYLTGSLCDIDCDYGAEARDKVISYLQSKYVGKFAKLSTYNTQTTKALLKDAGKVIGGFSEEHIKVYSDEIPVKFGKVAKPEKAYEESEKFKQFADQNPLVYNCVKKLQNCIKNGSSHASAYIVSHDPLNDWIPLQFGTDGEIVTSCDAEVSEKSIIKLDLLGLQSVTLLDNVCKSTGVNAEEINYESWEDIYIHLQNLETPSNLFQISGSAAVRGLNKIKPKSLDDLSAVLAICRPGSFVFLDQYADYVNGKGEKPSLHPLFDDILEKTAGVMLYQESLMALFVRVGFTLAEADDIRRIVGKKKVDEIAEWEKKIYEKCKENNIDEKAAAALWNVALMSADYSFNRCNSLTTKVLHATKGEIEIQKVEIGNRIMCFNPISCRSEYEKVKNIYHDEQELYRTEFDNGLFTETSLKHQFLVSIDDGPFQMRPIGELQYLSSVIRFMTKNGLAGLQKGPESIGVQKCIDLEIDSIHHNFYTNGVVTHNSHSVAYSKLTALSVYLKFNYPKHFFLEALKLTSEKQDPSSEIAELVQEMPFFGLRLLPPSLKKSSNDFTIEGEGIRYGLSSVKGISEKSIAHLQSFIDKEKSNLFQVFEAASQSKLNVSIVSSLIELGCLEDVSPYDRQKTVLLLKIWKELTPREKNYCLTNGEKYNFDLILMLKDYLTWTGENGKLLGKESRLETIRKKSAPFIQIYRENIKNPMVSQYLFEKKLLGYCPSTTLSDLFREYDDLTKIGAIRTDKYEKDAIKIVGEVTQSKTWTAKKTGNKCLKVVLSDETGNVSVLMTGAKCEDYIKEFKEPEEGQIIYVRGVKGPGDEFVVFVDHMAPQFLRIYERVSDLKGLEKEVDNAEISTSVEKE